MRILVTRWRRERRCSYSPMTLALARCHQPLRRGRRGSSSAAAAGSAAGLSAADESVGTTGAAPVMGAGASSIDS